MNRDRLGLKMTVLINEIGQLFCGAFCKVLDQKSFDEEKQNCDM